MGSGMEDSIANRIYANALSREEEGVEWKAFDLVGDYATIGCRLALHHSPFCLVTPSGSSTAQWASSSQMIQPE